MVTSGEIFLVTEAYFTSPVKTGVVKSDFMNLLSIISILPP
ncbi:MAG: hypothetical protein R3A12_02280 [Ignavibacteria bacterium]